MPTATESPPNDRTVVHAFAEAREATRVVHMAMTAINEAHAALARAQTLIDAEGLFRERPLLSICLDAVGMEPVALYQATRRLPQYASELDDATSVTHGLAADLREVWRLLEEGLCDELRGEVERRMGSGPHSN